ncbi:hypothetical protein HaLaN_17435 [Haematococcus lacustris]|uniref:Uncharacterized protein n=1 Tax=Haematococcus lacustris TaxID=44745 RepID=A0A699ZDX5_HAELA|nr:hypothetical protein HaLaN_17435 [Haematococcus lacustris]
MLNHMAVTVVHLCQRGRCDERASKVTQEVTTSAQAAEAASRASLALLVKGEAALASLALKDLQRDWEASLAEQALRDLVRKAKVSQGGEAPQALSGPPPEIPQEGAVWLLLLAASCALAQEDGQEAERLLGHAHRSPGP